MGKCITVKAITYYKTNTSLPSYPEIAMKAVYVVLFGLFFILIKKVKWSFYDKYEKD